MAKKQQRVDGDIVRIDLGEGFHSYARVLDKGLMAFYDARVNEELSIDRILGLPILFTIGVMYIAITTGRWVVVGNAPLEDSLVNPPLFFIQDALNKKRFSIYEKNGKIRPATKEECIGLERAAVWEANHVEDRLRDHYAGHKNKWLESLKIK